MFNGVDIKELLWYLFAGGCSTIVSQVGYSVLYRFFHFSNVISKSVSWVLAASVAYVLTRYLAFADTQTTFSENGWKFFVTRILTAVLTVALMWLVIDKILKWDLRDRQAVKERYWYWPEVINLGVTGFEVILNYFIAKFYVF